MKFKDYARGERLRAGLTQTELGNKVGVSLTTVSNIERGQAKPSDTLIERYAELFNTDPTIIDEYKSKRWDVSKSSMAEEFNSMNPDYEAQRRELNSSTKYMNRSAGKHARLANLLEDSTKLFGMEEFRESDLESLIADLKTNFTVAKQAEPKSDIKPSN